MPEINGKNIFCYKGVCPSNFESSETFRKNVNRELAKDGLVWTGDVSGTDNAPNEVDKNEIAFIGGGKFAGSASDWVEVQKKITAAVVRYFQAYEKYIKTIGEKVRLVEVSTPINYGLYPEDHREVYKAAVDIFLNEVNPLISELYLLQTNPRLVATRSKTEQAIIGSGEEAWQIALKFIGHNIVGTCPDSVDSTAFFESCSLFPVAPTAPAINALLPYDVTDKDLVHIDAACRKFGGENPEALRPDTVVEWRTERPAKILNALELIETERQSKKDNPRIIIDLTEKRTKLLAKLYDEIKVTPLPKHPIFAETCRKLAAALHKMANLTINEVALSEANPALARQFLTTAIYFERGDLDSATEAIRWAIMQKDGPFFVVTSGTESYWKGPKHWAWAAVGQYVESSQRRLDKLVKYSTMPRECRTSKMSCDATAGIATYLKVVNILDFEAALIPQEGSSAGWNSPNYNFPNLNIHDMVLVQNVLEVYDNAKKLFKEALLGKYNDLATQFGRHAYIAAHENGHTLLGGDNITVESGTHRGKSARELFGESWLWYKETHADLHVATTLINLLEDTSVDWATDEGKELMQTAKEMFFGFIYYTISGCPKSNSLEVSKEAHQVSDLIRNGLWLKEGLYRLEGSGAEQKIVFNLSDPDKISKEEMLFWLEKAEEFETKSEQMIKDGDTEGYAQLLKEVTGATSQEFIDFIQAKKSLIDRSKY